MNKRLTWRPLERILWPLSKIKVASYCKARRPGSILFWGTRMHNRPNLIRRLQEVVALQCCTCNLMRLRQTNYNLLSLTNSNLKTSLSGEILWNTWTILIMCKASSQELNSLFIRRSGLANWLKEEEMPPTLLSLVTIWRVLHSKQWLMVKPLLIRQ